MPPGGIDIQTLLAMLLGQFPQLDQQLPGGTPEQQSAGQFGGLGGAMGAPYGLFGSFYGGRVPQMQQGPQMPQLQTGLGARGFGA